MNRKSWILLKIKSLLFSLALHIKNLMTLLGLTFCLVGVCMIIVAQKTGFIYEYRNVVVFVLFVLGVLCTGAGDEYGPVKDKHKDSTTANETDEGDKIS